MKYNIKTQKHSKKTLKRPLLKTAATVLSALFITAMLISCTGCSRKENGGIQNTETVQNTETTQNTDGENRPDTVNDSSGADGTSAAAMISATAQPSDTAVSSETPDAADASSTSAAAPSSSSTAAKAETASTAAPPEYKGLVVIDPGHQQYANTEQEPVGPGASETKIKVSGGTTGTATGVPEYELTLDIGLQLRDKLLERGYQVIMVRDTNEVDISNSERAEIANEADADVFIRLHANGSPDSSVTGAMTICQTPANPYNGDVYEQSRALSENILDSYIYKTGINRQYVWETDTMQQKMVEGIADGIDEYMKQFPPKERDETFFRQNEEEEASSGQNNSRETSEEDLSKEETSGETEETSEEEPGHDGETKAETKKEIIEETEGPPEGTAAAEDN